MKAQISLEHIGASQDARMYSLGRLAGWKSSRRPWVAEIVGKFPSGKLDREFIDGKNGYLHSNSKGSRGVNVVFILETNKLYQVHFYSSWKSCCEYFCAVTENGDIKKLTESEANEWLKFL